MVQIITPMGREDLADIFSNRALAGADPVKEQSHRSLSKPFNQAAADKARKKTLQFISCPGHFLRRYVHIDGFAGTTSKKYL